MSEEAPSTRHGDVLLTVWIIVGATVFFVLSLSDTFHLPKIALAVLGAMAAGYGEAVARALRPHVRFTETAVAVVIAFLLLPQVARFGGKAFDRDALLTIAIGTPLGLGAAWQMRRWHAGAGNFPAVAAGVFLAAASVGLGVAALVALAPKSSIEHILEAAFIFASIGAGLSFGCLVPGARPGHLILGAMVVLLAPRLMSIGILRHVPAFEVIKWTGALGIGGALGVLVGRPLRAHALARIPTTNLPPARVVDGDAGENADPR